MTLTATDPYAPDTAFTTPFVRLRIELPDHPGALAAVSRVLATRGLNVVELAIHEVDGPRAVDEIVVHTHPASPLTWHELAPPLRSAGAELLSVAPCDMRTDPVVSAMTWLTATLESPGRRGALVTGIRLLTGLDKAQVLTRDEALKSPIGVAAVQQRRVIVQRLADPPPQLRGSVDESREGGMWVLAVPDGPMATYVVMAARPYAVRFTATEINRVVAVLDCRRRLLELVRQHPVDRQLLSWAHGVAENA